MGIGNKVHHFDKAVAFKTTSKIVVFVFFLSLIGANVVFAGFGVSPPYVRNDSLIRGSHYEKKLILVRGDAIEDLQATITIDVPTAGAWISIDRGMEFILPKGEKQIPIIVSVDVPNDAAFGRYKGDMKIRIRPLSPLQEEGGVSIILGLQVDIDLEVGKEEIMDFAVKGVSVADLEEGHKVWFWYIPGKIKFSIKIENLGNVKAAPSKVHINIYDAQEKEMLESVETTKIEKVNSFEIKTVVAELSTKLPAGSYWAHFVIFKKDEVVNKGRLHLSILPYGTLPPEVREVEEFLGLSIWIWIVVGLIIVAGIGYVVWRFRLKKKK